MTKLNAVRALTAYTGRRFVRITTIIAGVITGLMAGLTWVLAHFLSPWWWLLLIPVVLLVITFLIVRFVVLLFVKRVYVGTFDSEQGRALKDFSGKIQALVEARGTPPQLFVLITIKDLLFDRDITTIRKLVRDSVGLRRDFAELEKLF